MHSCFELSNRLREKDVGDWRLFDVVFVQLGEVLLDAFPRLFEAVWGAFPDQAQL